MLFALAVFWFLPITEAAAATALVTAPVAVLVTLRMTRFATDGFSDALLAGLAVLALVFAVAGFTVFGAALPKVFFPASLDRAADAAPAPVFDSAAFPFLGAAFFALVAMALFLLAGCGATRADCPTPIAPRPDAAVRRSGHKRNPFHPFSCFDTATLAGLAYGQTVLSRAIQAAGYEWNPAEAHSAVYDAERTAQLFCAIVNRWKHLEDCERERVG